MKLFLKNIANTYFIIACLILAIPLSHDGLMLVLRSIGHEEEDSRALLPNYASLPWSTKHFAEFHNLKTDFKAFVGWQRRPFQGETITLDPIRRNRITPPPSEPTRQTVYFFGGSTMWGTGSDDANTIPFHFQRVSKFKAVNFGESGWLAHQSLNQLFRLYLEGDRPELVIFYSGVNEIGRCRSEVSHYAYSREGEIQNALAFKPYEGGYLLRVLTSVAAMLPSSLGRAVGISAPPGYDCDSNPQKAELVAEAMVMDWEIARDFVQSHGGKFAAFLQPVAFEGAPKVDAINLDTKMGAQYKALYPIMRRKMSERQIGYDLSNSFDIDQFIYIDFCHVSPNGNEIVADKIWRQVRTRETQAN